MYCVEPFGYKPNVQEAFAIHSYTQYINTVGSSQVSRLPGLLFRGALLYATEYRVYVYLVSIITALDLFHNRNKTWRLLYLHDHR